MGKNGSYSLGFGDYIGIISMMEKEMEAPILGVGLMR